MTDRSDLILQYFAYLITEFDFSVEEKEFDPQMMGNAIALFKSYKIGIEVVIDRNQVLMALGDQMEPREKWFDYSDILQFFSSSEAAYSDIGQLFDEKRPNFTSNEDTWDEVVRAQLYRLAFTLRHYCESILKGDLSMKKEIKEIEEKRVAQMLKKFEKINRKSMD